MSVTLFFFVLFLFSFPKDNKIRSWLGTTTTGQKGQTGDGMILLEQNEKSREPGRKMSRKDEEAFRGARMGSLVDMVKDFNLTKCGMRGFSFMGWKKRG